MSINLNLVVIKSSNIKLSVSFYQKLGLIFKEEKHGNGPYHYSCKLENLVFEIYPSSSVGVDEGTRIGFNVVNVEKIVANLRLSDSLIMIEPTITRWGKRAVVQDPDGHKVELLETQDK